MGSVVLSIDAELGWGFHDLPAVPTRRVERARWGWRKLVDLLDEFRIPATWAIVGHLFLEECDRRHASHPVPDDWFARERSAWRDRPDLRFGRDLIDAVTSSSVGHEIGCHSFSHVLFGGQNTTRELADAEIREAHRSMQGQVDRSTSFIFPRNRVGHLDVLADWGYTCYRGRRQGTTNRLGKSIGKVVQSTVGEPGLVEPTVDSFGLVNIPSSMYLFGFEGISRRIVRTVSEDPIVMHARRGIDATAESDADAVFHMWLHPNNITDSQDISRLRSIFELLRAERNDRNVKVETMREVADRTLPDGTARSTRPEPNHGL